MTFFEVFKLKFEFRRKTKGGGLVCLVAFTIDEAIKEAPTMDGPATHFASEKSLAKDWLTPEEDLAWKDL